MGALRRVRRQLCRHRERDRRSIRSDGGGRRSHHPRLRARVERKRRRRYRRIATDSFHTTRAAEWRVAPAAPGGGTGIATGSRATTSGIKAKALVSCSGLVGATCPLVLRLAVTETLKSGKVIAVTARTKLRKKVVVLEQRHHTGSRSAREHHGLAQRRWQETALREAHAQGEARHHRIRQRRLQGDDHVQLQTQEKALRRALSRRPMPNLCSCRFQRTRSRPGVPWRFCFPCQAA